MAAKKTDKAVTVVLDTKEPKKHVCRFDTEDEGAAIKTVYIDNATLKKLGDPDAVKITIEAA